VPNRSNVANTGSNLSGRRRFLISVKKNWKIFLPIIGFFLSITIVISISFNFNINIFVDVARILGLVFVFIIFMVLILLLQRQIRYKNSSKPKRPQRTIGFTLRSTRAHNRKESKYKFFSYRNKKK
jgi:hypothetical protein